MDPKEVLLETTARIDSGRTIKVTGKYPYTQWIIKRYIHYMIEAILHGYVIKVYNENGPIAKISLNYSPVENLKKSVKRRFLFSTRMFGFMFYVSITGRFINTETFYFLMDFKLRKRITDLINSDTIYQFIKT